MTARQWVDEQYAAWLEEKKGSWATVGRGRGLHAKNDKMGAAVGR